MAFVQMQFSLTDLSLGKDSLTLLREIATHPVLVAEWP